MSAPNKMRTDIFNFVNAGVFTVIQAVMVLHIIRYAAALVQRTLYWGLMGRHALLTAQALSLSVAGLTTSVFPLSRTAMDPLIVWVERTRAISAVRFFISGRYYEQA